MSRQTGAVLVGLLMLAVSAGCAESNHKCCCQQPAPLPPPPPLPTVARGNMESLFRGLPSLLPAESLPGSALDGPTAYYALTPKDCQCMAARCCGVANLMAIERKAIKCQDNSKCMCVKPKKPQGGAFKQEILESAEQEARDQQAGAALELYYRLAEAEAGLDLLQASVDELDSALVTAKELRERNIISESEYQRLGAQRAKTLTDRTELQMNVGRLNVELGKLVCVNICPGEAQFWPLVDLDATCQEVNVEAAVKLALANRGELKILRAIQRDLSLLTLPAAREAMRSINGLLGSADPKYKFPQLQILAETFCHEGPYSIELQARRRQLALRIAEREAAIAGDVREEAMQASRRCQTASLAKARADSLGKVARDLEELHKKQLNVTAADVTKAKLEWIQARGDVVKEVSARERAKAKLKQHEGILPMECPDPEPSCDSGGKGRRSCGR